MNDEGLSQRSDFARGVVSLSLGSIALFWLSTVDSRPSTLLLIQAQAWFQKINNKQSTISNLCPQAEKLSPQEQWATALGLVTLNPPFWRSSL